MPLEHPPVPQAQHIDSFGLARMAELDQQTVDARLNTGKFETKLRALGQCSAPIVAKRVLSDDDAPAIGKQARGQRRGKYDIVVKQFQNRIYVMGIPRIVPAAGKLGRIG